MILLGLGDESLLQHLHLLYHLVLARVAALNNAQPCTTHHGGNVLVEQRRGNGERAKSRAPSSRAKTYNTIQNL